MTDKNLPGHIVIDHKFEKLGYMKVSRYRKEVINFLIEQSERVKDDALSIIEVGSGQQGVTKKLFSNGGHKLLQTDVKDNSQVKFEQKINLEEKIPAKLIKGFDMVIAVEVLEHVFDIQSALIRLVNLCRDGGNIVITVPFYFHVHGTNDFHRPTKHFLYSVLAKYCKRVNIFALGNTSEMPYGWGVVAER